MNKIYLGSLIVESPSKHWRVLDTIVFGEMESAQLFGENKLANEHKLALPNKLIWRVIELNLSVLPET